MQPGINTVQLLGAAQLVVFIASLTSERLLASALGSGTISDQLVHLTQRLTRLRLSNLVALINSLAIILLGALFYLVLGEQNRLLALVALGCFIAEAIALAISKIGTFALIPVSQSFVAAGAPENSHFQTLGDFLYAGVYQRGYDIHMLFFCLGGILWYYLLVISRITHPWLALWGLIAICLLTIPTAFTLLDLKYNPTMILGLPYVPFELVLGLWLLIGGK